MVIRESLVKNGVAVYRCGLEAGDIMSRSLEIPQRMFDLAIRCGPRRAERPVIDRETGKPVRVLSAQLMEIVGNHFWMAYWFGRLRLKRRYGTLRTTSAMVPAADIQPRQCTDSNTRDAGPGCWTGVSCCGGCTRYRRVHVATTRLTDGKSRCLADRRACQRNPSPLEIEILPPTSDVKGEADARCG